MIEFDYEIIRDEGDEVVTYEPDKIPTELPNIVYIEGPNSSGKSTLLNIIALGLYGLKNDKLDSNLKTQINHLVNSNHQELTFNLKIKKQGRTIIESEKPDGDVSDIKVYEYKDGNRTPIMPDNFQNKYNLIYDIPQNPIDRLNQLIKEIRNTQRNYKKDVKYFRKYLRNTIEEINSSRNPKLISQKKKEIKENEKEIENKKAILKKKEETLDQLEKYTYSRFIRDYTAKCTNLHEQIEDLEGKLEHKERTKKARDSKLGNRIEETREQINQIEDIHLELSDILKSVLPDEEKHHLDIWNRISFNDVIETLEFEDDLEIEVNDLKEIVSKKIEEKDEEKALTKAEMYNGLIDFLEDYKIEDILVPGVEKDVNEFIEILETKAQKYEDTLNYYDNLEKAKSHLNELESKISKVENKLFPNIRNLKEKRSEDYVKEEYRDYQNRLESKRELLEEYDKKLQKYEHKYAKKALDPDNIEEIYSDVIDEEEISSYTNYTEKELNQKIKSLKDQIEDIEDRIKELEFQIEMDKNKLSSLKSEEKHKYHNQREEIKNLNQKAKILESKLNDEYDKYITKLIDEDINIDECESEEERKYYEKVSNYLGNKVGFIRHGQEEYQVEYIDLIKNVIKTESGKEIMLSDMGTGQSQSAYLKGLLNTNDNRKIIALFDEVAMMDTYSLNPIYEKFKELYQKDQLLAGVVVQKADEMNTVSKMEM